MGKLCQWVGLIHKLGELGSPKELPYSRNYRAHIDQGAGGNRLGIDNAHPFPDHALHTKQTQSELIPD